MSRPNDQVIRVECAHDKIVSLKELKEHPGNPNKHPPEQIKLLAKIIRVSGWRNPIVISNRSGLITKGHARLKAATLLEQKTVPVDFQDYANEQDEIADMIADNWIAELADLDRSLPPRPSGTIG
jgi:ParB-like chromosome segregation protein Spo0J